MRVLLTNDDGLEAPGLAILEEIVAELGWEAWIVAPDRDRSGVGRSISLNEPLRLFEHGKQRFSLRGTPADCVVMGAKYLMPDLPDLVLSGVNCGQNICEDITVSGTAGAALEALSHNIPAIALSQSYSFTGREDIFWQTARACAPPILQNLADMGIGAATGYNVNFPHCAPDDVAGIAITRQGKRDNSALEVIKREDGRGLDYYWLAYSPAYSEAQEGTDLHALRAHKISLTPFSLNVTDEEKIAIMKEEFS